MSHETDQKNLTIAIAHDQPTALRGNVYTTRIWGYPATNEDGSIMGYGPNFQQPDHYYPYLNLRSHIFSDMNSSEACSVELTYQQMMSVNLQTAQAMAKTLVRIQRREQQYHKKHSYPNDFGQYIKRFAWAIGAKTVWVWNQEGRSGLSYSIEAAIPIINQLCETIAIEGQIVAGSYKGTIVRYTNADKDYDGFGTITLAEHPYESNGIGQVFRQVEIQGSAYKWQKSRYQSGGKLLLTEKEVNDQYAIN